MFDKEMETKTTKGKKHQNVNHSWSEIKHGSR